MAVVDHVRPKGVLIENVPDLPGWDDGAVLIGFFESLRELGYRVDARILDALQHGVPQHRARLFIVGLRSGRRMHWPDPAPTRPNLRDAIGDLPPVPPAQREERVRYFGSPETSLQRELRGEPDAEHVGWIHDHMTRDVRPDDAEASRLLGEGQTYEDLPDRLRRYRSDIFTDKYKRLAWDEVSRSITAHIAKDGYWYIHPEQHRTLSFREAARVQTFPDSFRFAGEPTHRLRQIGNAVPPRLATRLGEALRESLTSRPRRERLEADHFRRDLLSWHMESARQYPWRDAGLTPWVVLMAEMCLHRTRADQVVPVFESLRRLAEIRGVLASLERPTRERGTSRVETYRPLLARSDCPIVVADLRWLFHDPCYQLMRQTLLAWQMVEHKEFGATDWLHLQVVPAANSRLRGRGGAPEGLAGQGLSEVWSSVLRKPQRYRMMTPTELVSRIGNGKAWASWKSWLTERYLT